MSPKLDASLTLRADMQVEPSSGMTLVDWSELVRNYATVIALAVSSLWAGSKVAWSELLRRRKEIPALDSKDLAISSVALEGSGGHLITVGLTWRNPGSLPVHVDPAVTRTEVYRVPASLGEGPVDLKPDLQPALFQVFPIGRLTAYVLEPKTESYLQTHFVLAAPGLYAIRVKIARSQKHHGKGEFEWGREVVTRVPVPDRPGPLGDSISQVPTHAGAMNEPTSAGPALPGPSVGNGGYKEPDSPDPDGVGT